MIPSWNLCNSDIDGASRFMQLRLVIMPHLVQLASFLFIVSIMDNFRVFEAIVGFKASAYASSRSILIFNDLRGGNAPLFASAAATSMLTILCIAILLVPSMCEAGNRLS